MSQRFKLIDFVWVNDEVGLIVYEESAWFWKFSLVISRNRVNYGFGGLLHSYATDLSDFNKYPRITEAELAILRLNGRIPAKIYEEISALKTQRH